MAEWFYAKELQTPQVDVELPYAVPPVETTLPPWRIEMNARNITFYLKSKNDNCLTRILNLNENFLFKATFCSFSTRE